MVLLFEPTKPEKNLSPILIKVAGHKMVITDIGERWNGCDADLFLVGTSAMEMTPRRGVHGARDIAFQDDPFFGKSGIWHGDR